MLYLWKFNNHIDDKIHDYYSIIISYFLILAFHTTVITIVDRSISVFLISSIDNGIDNPTKIKKKFVDDFSEDGIKKRINEQKKIGNIQSENGNLYLTWKGELYNKFFGLIQFCYNTDERIISENDILKNNYSRK